MNDGVVVRGSGRDFQQAMRLGRHELKADEPQSVGGKDEGPSPYELLMAALGSCTSMTIGMYARRKGWPVEEITVRLKHSKIHAEDCESCDTKEGRVDRIEREIAVTGELTGEQRARLLEIAERCPVHRTLSSEIDIQSRLV